MPTRLLANRTVNLSNTAANGSARTPKNHSHNNRKEGISHGSCHPYVKNYIACPLHTGGHTSKFGYAGGQRGSSPGGVFPHTTQKPSRPEPGRGRPPIRHRHHYAGAVRQFSKKPNPRRHQVRCRIRRLRSGNSHRRASAAQDITGRSDIADIRHSAGDMKDFAELKARRLMRTGELCGVLTGLIAQRR